jgi:hypothetical protein
MPACAFIFFPLLVPFFPLGLDPRCVGPNTAKHKIKWAKRDTTPTIKIKDFNRDYPKDRLG